MRELPSLTLPLISARLKLADEHPTATLVQEVLAEEGLALRDVQVRGIREMFFSRGERPALCVPEALTHSFEDDELHPDRQKLVLAFDLPRGSYATLVVKRAARLTEWFAGGGNFCLDEFLIPGAAPAMAVCCSFSDRPPIQIRASTIFGSA